MGWRGKNEGTREADTRSDFNVIFHVILGVRLEEAKARGEEMGGLQERSSEGLMVGKDEIDSREIKGLELGKLSGWLDRGSNREGDIQMKISRPLDIWVLP